MISSCYAWSMKASAHWINTFAGCWYDLFSSLIMSVPPGQESAKCCSVCVALLATEYGSDLSF